MMLNQNAITIFKLIIIMKLTGALAFNNNLTYHSRTLYCSFAISLNGPLKIILTRLSINV